MSQQSFEATPAPEHLEFESTAVQAAPRKHEFNIYTVMLIISFLCLLAGSILLFMELFEYGSPFGGSPWKTTDAQPRLTMLLPQLPWLA